MTAARRNGTGGEWVRRPGESPAAWLTRLLAAELPSGAGEEARRLLAVACREAHEAARRAAAAERVRQVFECYPETTRSSAEELADLKRRIRALTPGDRVQLIRWLTAGMQGD
jgi:hypothetical protein